MEDVYDKSPYCTLHSSNNMDCAYCTYIGCLIIDLNSFLSRLFNSIIYKMYQGIYL